MIEINRIIKSDAPEIYDWMKPQIKEAVELGWLCSS
jgi:hypothetical protein